MTVRRSPGRPWAVILSAIWLIGCATRPGQVTSALNSDQILARYGSYGVEVLFETSNIRIANLYSSAGENQTCRTYAVTRYSLPIASELASAHEAIVAGQSIGATLRSEGWVITKQGLHVGQLATAKLPERVRALMMTDSEFLAVYEYELLASKGAKPISYATIAEIYHPDYLSVTDLRRRHPEIERNAVLSAATRNAIALSLPD